MKKLLIALVIGALSLIGISQSDAVIKVVGGQAECDTALVGCQVIPLTFTQMCISPSVCPPTSQPSLTDPLRFWGGSSTCRTSTNGGGTWIACAGAPGVGTDFSIAGTADGNVVVAGTAVATCTIKKSIDNGLNWVTKLAVASRNCNTQSGFGSLLRCRLDGGCVLPFFNSSDTLCYTYTSSDNGENWSTGAAGIACTMGGNQTTVAWDGSVGLMGNRGIVNGISRTWRTSGGTWGISSIWSPGTNLACAGTVIMNSSGHVLCQSTVNILTMRTTEGVLEQTITLPNTTPGVGSANGPLAASIGTNIIYVIYPISAGTSLGVYVSRDGGASFNQIGTSGTGTAGMNGGDMYMANGCIYWSAGVGVMFGKVC